MKIGLKNLDDGTPYKRYFFTTMVNILGAREDLQDAGTWNHVAVAATGEELPYFFSDVPYYAMKHKKGRILGPWCGDLGNVRRRFSNNPLRLEDGYGELLLACNWTVIDHQHYPVHEGQRRHWVTPEVPGLLALMYSRASHRYVYLTYNNKVWFSNMHGLRTFANQHKLPRHGVTIIESLGDGTWKKRPDLAAVL